RVWRRLLENSLSAKVSCWLIRLLILGSGYNTMISHLGLIRTFPNLISQETLPCFRGSVSCLCKAIIYFYPAVIFSA
ncbi:hypothetical protein, partial [Klebsiella quasipneumoniae]|uniref:hypothetical protein n=1 Tax=Klebsiella quasipneumoniae TaxID=1463165 RepID=UPI001BAAA7C2